MAAMSPLAFAFVLWGTVALVVGILAYEVYILLIEIRPDSGFTR